MAEVKILWVSELGRDAVWLEALGILLVDASFTAEAARQMIVQATSMP